MTTCQYCHSGYSDVNVIGFQYKLAMIDAISVIYKIIGLSFVCYLPHSQSKLHHGFRLNLRMPIGTSETQKLTTVRSTNDIILKLVYNYETGRGGQQFTNLV